MELNKYIDSQGISIAKFARIIGVSINTIGNICRGKPTLKKNALKIIETTNGIVTIEDLKIKTASPQNLHAYREAKKKEKTE